MQVEFHSLGALSYNEGAPCYAKIQSDPAVLTTKQEDNISRLALTLLKQLLHDVLIMIGHFYLLRHVCSCILQVFCGARRGQMIRPNSARLLYCYLQ